MFIYIYKMKNSKNYSNAELNNAIKEAKNYNSVPNAAKTTTSGCDIEIQTYIKRISSEMSQ